MIDAPASASARGYLTQTLPAVYLEPQERPSQLMSGSFGDPAETYEVPWGSGLEHVLAPLVDEPRYEPFVVRWLSGLEQVLDPIVTLLDNLSWHFDVDLSPDDLVRELLCWLGLDVAADLAPAVRRELLRNAMAIGRRRGTLAGLRELLRIAFAELEIEVTHNGLVSEGADPGERPPAALGSVVVRCATAPTAQQRDELRRLVDFSCPAHVAWTLEIGPPAATA